MKRTSEKGFGGVEIFFMIMGVIIIIAVGLVVYERQHKSPAATSMTSDKYSSASVQSAAEKLSQDLAKAPSSTTGASQDTGSSASTDSSSTPTGSDATATPPSPSTQTFTATYDDFTFSYPGTWSGKVWSNDTQSSGITLTSPDGNVHLSYGSPVVKPSTATCTPSSSTLYIYNVSKGPVLTNTDTLYVVEYSDGGFKSVALTDWGGKEPVAGETDKCSGYQPSFVDKATGVYSWFKVSDESDTYRADSASTFFNTLDVTAATDIINSSKN